MESTFEERARELVEAGKILYEKGLVPATSGNFSARISDDRIAITVTGKHKGQLTVADIMQVNMQGQSLDGRPPSAKITLHLQIYSRFHDAAIILHHHSLYATLLSQITPNEVVFSGYEILKAFPDIKTHEVSVRLPVFDNSQDMSVLAAAADAYMDSNSPVYGYLIRGHGLFTWGETLDDALRHVEAFEFLCNCELMKRGMR